MVQIKKIVVVLMIGVLASVALVGCGSKWRYGALRIYDYYGEYQLVTPFEAHYFLPVRERIPKEKNPTLSMEFMQESLDGAGFGTSLFQINGTQRLLITKTQESGVTYFLIYETTRAYILEPLCQNFGDASALSFGKVFLFPNHWIVANRESEAVVTNDGVKGDKIRVECSWDQFADFYRQTGRSDMEIDEQNQSVLFACRANAQSNWAGGQLKFWYADNGGQAEILIEDIG